MNSEQRINIDNGIHLCATCATKIDKNVGLDFSVEFLKNRKELHEKRIADEIGNSANQRQTSVSGSHSATGIGTVIGLEINSPTRIEPGTVSTAFGIGRVVGTKIGG